MIPYLPPDLHPDDYQRLRDAAKRHALQLRQEAIRDAMHVIGSKSYLRFQFRDAFDAPWQTLTIDLEPDKVLPLRLYIRVPAEQVTQTSQSFTMRIATPDGAVGASAVAKFEAPEKP